MRFVATLSVPCAMAAFGCGGANESRGGSREVVTVAPVAATPIATKEDPKPVPAARPVDPDGDVNEVLAFIRTVSPTEHVFARAGVDLLLERQASLMRSCRIVPEVSNGVTVGIRVFGVRADSVLGRLGFQNGDRVDAINGMSVASPEQALEVYASVRTVDRLDVDIERRGKPMRLVVRVE